MRDRREKTESCPLEQLATQLRKSSEASARLYGGTTHHAEELALFKSDAKEHRLFLAAPPPELVQPPTADGHEPAIEGTLASLGEIRQFFESSGWLPFSLAGNLAFFDPSENLAVSDTHLGNIITLPDGQLAPIDLRVQRLSPSLVDTMKSLCNFS